MCPRTRVASLNGSEGTILGRQRIPCFTRAEGNHDGTPDNIKGRLSTDFDPLAGLFSYAL
jgi:hypothetical protein